MIQRFHILFAAFCLAILSLSSCNQNESTTKAARSALDSLKPEQALKLLEGKTFVDQSAEALILRGTASFQLKKYGDAIADFSSAAQLEPENYKPYYNRSLAFMESGKVNDAMIDLSKAIKLNPNEKDLYLNRGNLFFLKNEVADALSDFQKVLELDSSNTQALYNVAYIHGSGGNNSQAEIYYRRLLALEPDHLKALFGYGLALVQMNQREAGCEYLNKAYERGFQSAIKVIQVYCTNSPSK